ncbi:cyclic pyranopterin monophosphate synthase MoaC [Nocardia sp. BMG51109]|uniref:cyclic pyranopterin monophosphate synthase MoaC n=1 Tax=Nocardia sp. BMG51109 TaxID=1056816 RepID=UPI0004646056
MSEQSPADPALSHGDPALSHLDSEGRARMVDVSAKSDTARVAVAAGALHTTAEVVRLVQADDMPKADVLATARIAGISGAKKTSELIPLCHQLALSSVDVHFGFAADAITIEATAKTKGPTGVEMEALTAVAVAGLTLHDMVKAVDPAAVLTGVRLLTKDGGKRGHWDRARIAPDTASDETAAAAQAHHTTAPAHPDTAPGTVPDHRSSPDETAPDRGAPSAPAQSVPPARPETADHRSSPASEAGHSHADRAKAVTAQPVRPAPPADGGRETTPEPASGTRAAHEHTHGGRQPSDRQTSAAAGNAAPEGTRTAAVVVASTGVAAGTRVDKTGPVLVDWLAGKGFSVRGPLIYADADIAAGLADALSGAPGLVITTGGTGASPTDATPEATLAVLDRELPGVAEAIRQAGTAAFPLAALSRGVAGQVGRSVVVNLPGSSGGVRDGIGVLEPLLDHLLAQVAGGGSHD